MRSARQLRERQKTGISPVVLLAIIVLLGAAVRLYHLSTVPTELTFDEVDLYNSARSIAMTGHDVDGTLLPFTYSRVTRNPPIYAIAAYASSIVFGKTPFGLRLPAVAFGLASILLMYGIALRLTERKDIALIAALLQATLPIFVQFSRVAWEPAAELPMLLGGLLVLIATCRDEDDALPSRQGLSLRGLALSAALLALTCYTYLAGWFYAVALGGSLILCNIYRLRNLREWAKIFGACCIWLVVALPALWMCFFDPLTRSRRAGISTFAHGLSLETLQTFAHNYLAHFTLSYLAQTGAPQPGLTWRYLDGFGAMYWFAIPLAALGVAATFRYVRGKGFAAWLWSWLLIYPLGGALTNEGAPNAARTLAGAPVFCILAAIGAVLLIDSGSSLRLRKGFRVPKNWLYALLAVVCLGSLFAFALDYFTEYPHRNSNAWDSGTRTTFETVVSLSGGYKRVCFSVHPAWYSVDSYARFYLDGVRLKRYDEISELACSLPATLVVVDSNHPLSRAGFREIAATTDVDGSPFAIIYGRAPTPAVPH